MARVKRKVLVPAAAVLVVVAVIAASILLVSLGTDSGDAGSTSGATAAVQRRDLTRTETLDGVVAYQDLRDLGTARTGIVTRLPAVGSDLHAGQVLMAIDEQPVVLLTGAVPAWRSIGPGVAPGVDVAQLESSLVALGLAKKAVGFPDTTWDERTTTAVRALQAKIGAETDGVLSLGDVVFTAGSIHVAKLDAHVGGLVTPESSVLKVQSTDRIVTLELDPLKRDLIIQGAPVEVELPTGERIPGKLTAVSTTLSENAEGKSVYTVTVTLDDPKQVAGTALAPVTVHYVATVAKQVLSVPTLAIIGVPGGGYAVNVVEDGRKTRVSVELGAWGDGYVQVTGDLTAGQKVEVPT